MTDLQTNNKWLKPLIITLAFLLPLLYFFSPMIFQGERPEGIDISASKGNTHLYVEYQKDSGEKVLWNPNIFSGMPIYPRITPTVIHVDSFISLLGKLIYSYFWYYLLGGLGVFFLLRYRQIPWYIALIPAIAYMLLPHWMALLHVGHFAKLRAFMAMPWFILSFNYLFDKRSWMSVGLFALAFSWLVRTQHVQVTFYGILILLFVFLVPAVRMLVDKKSKEFLSFAMKLAVGIVLTIAVSSQPFISLQEYTPHSTRGGNAVQMEEHQLSASENKGAGLDYATQWSLDAKGIASFVIPHFAGGLSLEPYSGSKYPHLKGRDIPGYWGKMPFTQSYDFVGILILIFALYGIWAYWKKDAFVRGLSVFSGFALLLGLGRHFMPLYKLFFNVVPYFNKFRVPSMIMNMIFLALIILAAYGIKALIEKATNKEWKEIAILFGSAFGVLALIYLVSGSFAYEKNGELARYGVQTMNMIKGIRKEMLQADLVKAMLLVLAGGGVLLLHAFRKIKVSFTYVLIALLVSLELFSVSNRAYKNIPLGNPVSLERREFRQSDITRYLAKQNKDSRAFALGKDSNHYSYFYPTISGYSAIKLQTIQDLREHCLYKDGKLNWNVVNMLGGKYIIVPGRYPDARLQVVASDEGRGEILYENNSAFPKVWLVEKTKSFDSNAEILQYMNTAEFKPKNEVLLLNSGQQSYSAEGQIKLTLNTPNRLEFDVSLSEAQFAVFSEMYYPEGWKLFKGEEKLEIVQSNYALRGAELPAGEYTLVMTFSPRSYHVGMGVVWIADAIMIVLIFGSIFLNRDRLFNRKKKTENE